MKNAVVIEKLITMTWTLSGENVGVTVIPEEHVPALDEKGMELVSQQFLKDVSTAGTLTDNIKMLPSDPEDGIAYTGTWEITDARPEAESYRLPYGVEISESGVSSELYKALRCPSYNAETDDLADGGAEALECFLLALAREGVNLNDPRIRRALQTTVDQITSEY